MGLADIHELIPILAAAGEKSKAAFYISGGVLAAWAVIVSVIGVTRPGFPGGRSGERAVIGVSVLLVALTITMAVVTASKPPKENVAQAKSPALPIPPPPGVQPAAGASAPAPSGAPAPATGGAPGLTLAADPSGQLAYDKKSLTAKAGAVKIDFTNNSPVPHNVTIQKGSTNVAASATVTQSKASVTAQLKPGTYTFYCSVDAHRQAGMVGTLTVG
ncbi:MAG TPA: plastocyanin/azurin family copper-binding protein [Solirubrobacteraceae bacterium]|jgi:plastocyanin|nr:plastocyanin/azurin family copper-binding protein [Solirubrobacteraceae bacterium]